MDILPLPQRPDADQYRKRAKELVAVTRSGVSDALRDWSSGWMRSLLAALDVEPSEFVRQSIARTLARIEQSSSAKHAADDFRLADAHFLIAQAHGFENWPMFVQHLATLSKPASEESALFERAADAVVSGDLATLRTLIVAHPHLIRARSTRVHGATLLHYVAANGVEDFRQTTPANAVAVARLLLDAGAEPDAVADTYGGGTYQTTMNLLVSSAHPAAAGLMSSLAEVLLDYGAAIDGVADDESPLLTALYFGYGDAAETLARRGARIDTPSTAGALGRLDLVRAMIISPKAVKPGVPLVTAPWMRERLDESGHIALTLAWACKFAREEVAAFLIGLDVDPASRDNFHMTALHWAAANGMLAIVDELLRRNAPLEVENVWGGTVLNSTLHFALYIPVAGVDYAPVVERLLVAGADAGVVEFPTGTPRLDELLARFRARRIE